jgi:probable dihydroxyacetone kinase regulator
MSSEVAAVSDAQITKKALAASLKRLMKDAPLARISVKDIVEDCGLNRQTFYYHFRDKYGLVNWIYRTEAMEGIADARDYAHWTEGIARVFSYLLENRDFYVKALGASGPGEFDRYLFEATHDLVMGVVDEVASGLDVLEADRLFIADFYDFAFVGIAVRWIKGGMNGSPLEITERIGDIVEGSMRRALEKRSRGGKSLIKRPAG